MPDPLVNVLLDGERLRSDALALLRRMEVRESDSDPTVLALVFGLEQRADGELVPLDETLLEPGARVSVDLAAPGGLPERLFQGFITHLRPHFESIPANCYLEVLAMDMAVAMDAHERVEAWPDVTDADVASQILGRYGIDVQPGDTAALHEEDRRLLVQRGTDWRFLQRLARRNGFRLWLDADPSSDRVTAHFDVPDLGSSPQPDVIILQDDHNLQWVDIQLVGVGPVKTTGASIDPLAKRIIRGEGEPVLDLLGDVDISSLVSDALTSAGADDAVALLRDPVSLDGAIGAEASGATDANRFVLELRGELDPALYRGLLRARKCVLVRGVGRRFSGSYYVQAVRTALVEGALSQTFVAVRNATGQTGQEDFGQSAEEVPPQ